MAGMVQQVQDPLLKQTIQKIESSKMDPAMRKSYDQIAAAGMKVMWSDGEVFQRERDQALSQINGPEDVPKVISHVAVKIMAIVQNESKQQDILLGAGPATILFMCHALEFVEAAKKIQVTEDMLAETTSLTKEGLMDLYKITPDVLQKIAQGNDKAGKPQEAPAQPATPPVQAGGA